MSPNIPNSTTFFPILLDAIGDTPKRWHYKLQTFQRTRLLEASKGESNGGRAHYVIVSKLQWKPF